MSAPTLPALPTLDPERMRRGESPDSLRKELQALIYESLNNSPRSLQRNIGPSEVGTSCTRRLGYTLAHTPHPPRTGGWLPGIGTAVHALIAEMLAVHNTALGWSRFLLESRIEVGTIAGQPLRGSADVYDRATATVIDWKIVGKTTLDRVRRHGPTDVYRTQIHCYGAGFVNRGLPVDRVTIAYLPRNAELSGGSYWHTEDYDPSIPAAALARADAIAAALAALGPEAVIPQLNRADDCMFCPWHVRSLTGDDTNPATGCPGMKPARPTTAEELTGSP